jgi:hypothetical protein
VNEQVMQKSQVMPQDHKWEPRYLQEGKSSDLDVIL